MSFLYTMRYSRARILVSHSSNNCYLPQITPEQREAMDREAAELAASILAEFENDDTDEFALLREALDDEDDEEEDEQGTSYSTFSGLGDDVGENENELVDEDAEGSSESGSGRRDKRKHEVPLSLLPKVAVIGRPNVGKSALFNRLSGTASAIVYDTPGVTRDRLYMRAFWGMREFLLIDTGGLIAPSAMAKAGLEIPDTGADPGTALGAEMIPNMIENQAASGVKEADAVIMVADGQAGPCEADRDILAWMRRHHPNKTVILAVNKCESPVTGDMQAAAFWELGAEPTAISALSGLGTGDLLDRLMEGLPLHRTPTDEDWAQEDKAPLRVSIVGRPNVGKSSLVNAIVGEERNIVSKMSGTTRDAIDTDFESEDGKKFCLVDTAGIRKRAAVAAKKDGAEALAVKRAITAIKRAEVAVLVVDAILGATEQDFRLAENIRKEGRALVIVINKWDLVPEKTSTTMNQYETNLRTRLRTVDWAPVVFTTAIRGQRVAKVLDAIAAAGDEHRRRVTTATVNLVAQEACMVRLPPTRSGKKGRLYYATQAATRPPTFVLFVNDAKLFDEGYRRYMEKQFRQQIGFPGTPLRILWRGKAPNKLSNWEDGKDRGMPGAGS
ncbi:hypothetical protein CYMTET_20661 [Cymbomonas tetramitiformis]|uniref:GTPase Der n=1 Tax=Cymbomonas tetramitiformis TaxID=36881 RepID=A0AAE0G3L3_9CHLO|nr:hypothetical protein CYMTET_20661 [Cymbomonas tetramitiformis]